MCFFIHPDNINPKKAVRDIICYKLLDRQGVSIHREFKYELNFKYQTDLGVTRSPEMDYFHPGYIQEGFHSYDTDTFPDCIKNDSSMAIYKCIIPKGSTYYHNPSNLEYVSNQIIVEKQIN